MVFAESGPLHLPIPATKTGAEVGHVGFDLLLFLVARDVPACLTHLVLLLHLVAFVRNVEKALHREASKRTAAAGTATGDPRGLARNLGG